MFERFTRDARQAVVQAQEEARNLGHGYIGTEHLLLGLLERDESASSRVLIGLGLDHDVAVEIILRILGGDDLDGDALGTLGIDLDTVRSKVEEAFGPGALDRPARCTPKGHIPFSKRAKKALELALREALLLKHNHIGDGHILLGLLREGEGVAMKVIHERGIDPQEIRREITRALAA